VSLKATTKYCERRCSCVDCYEQYEQCEQYDNMTKTLIRSHLEYTNCVWSPCRQMDIEKIERVQVRATKMVEQLKNYSYEARLRLLNLLTLNTENYEEI